MQLLLPEPPDLIAEMLEGLEDRPSYKTALEVLRVFAKFKEDLDGLVTYPGKDDEITIIYKPGTRFTLTVHGDGSITGKAIIGDTKVGRSSFTVKGLEKFLNDKFRDSRAYHEDWFEPVLIILDGDDDLYRVLNDTSRTGSYSGVSEVVIRVRPDEQVKDYWYDADDVKMMVYPCLLKYWILPDLYDYHDLPMRQGENFKITAGELLNREEFVAKVLVKDGEDYVLAPTEGEEWTSADVRNALAAAKPDSKCALIIGEVRS